MASSWSCLLCVLLFKTVTGGASPLYEDDAVVSDVLYTQTADQFSPKDFSLLSLASTTTFLQRTGQSGSDFELLMVLSVVWNERGSDCTIMSYTLDVSRRGGRTWLPVSVSVSKSAIDDVGSCLCRPGFPWRAAADPTRQQMIFLSSSHTKQCNNKIMMVIGTELHVMTSFGGENVSRADWAVTTIPIVNTTTKYKLVAFGGCSGSQGKCVEFTSALWSVTIDSSRREAGRWERMDVVPNTTQPCARVGAYLFHDNGSLLLLGGVRVDPGYSTRLRDLWRYSIFKKQWFLLNPRNFSHKPMSTFNLRFSEYRSRDYAKNLFTAAFLSKDGVLAVLYKVANPNDGPGGVRLTVCRVQWNNFNCAAPKPFGGRDGLARLRHDSIMAGLSSFFVVKSNSMSLKLEVQISLRGNREKFKSTIVDVPWTSVTFPGFQNCEGGVPILAQNDFDWNGDGFGAPTILLLGGYCPADYKEWTFTTDLPFLPGMQVWMLRVLPDPMWKDSARYTLQYVNRGPPMPSRIRFTCTALTASIAILYGGEQFGSSDLADGTPWCFYMDEKWEHMRWQKVSVSLPQSVPEPRCGHVAMNVSKTTVMIHGGRSQDLKVLCDLWLLVVKENSCSGYWMNITTKGKPLPCRMDHTATYMEEGVLLYGGNIDIAERKRTEANLEYEKSLTLLRIDIHGHDINILVSRIPITPSIAPRSHHSLEWYTATDLLLLGGEYINDTAWYPDIPMPAFLIQLSRSGGSFAAKAIPYFRYSLSNHYVVGEFILSATINKPKPHSFFKLRNGQNCPIGYGRTGNNSCQPCEIGNYSDSIGHQCQPCGQSLTTKHTGASECEAQDPCVHNSCNGHGECFVDKAGKAYCKCEFGYLPNDNCKLPTVYLSQLAAVGFTAIITTLIISVVKFIKKRRDYRNKEKECRDNYIKLRCSERKLGQINKGAKLNWEDLTILQPPISRGTHSTVFKAQLTDMTVAVKQFRKYVSISDLTPYDIFIKEAETLRSLRHSNIVMFLAAGADNSTGRPFLVMEYLQRGSLYDILHDSAIDLTYDRRVKFALDGARGMEYLHGSNPPRLHRDIKSPNLLVSGNGVLKIGDLETARLLSILVRSSEGETQQEEQQSVQETAMNSELQCAASMECPITDQLRSPLLSSNVQVNASDCPYERPRLGMTCGVGTTRWRSPESIKTNTYNEKTDVYSFGVVLWEMLTRQTPYSHLTDSQQILQEIADGNKPILPPSAPYPFRHIAERCLKTEPKGRPTFPAIVRDLTSQQHGS